MTSVPPSRPNEHGAFVGSARDGRVSAAARVDYAEAAAVALLDDNADAIYELAGDASFTLADFAAELSRQAMRKITYADLPEADYRALLAKAGVPEPLAALLADSDAAASEGALFDDSRQLSRLINRATTPFAATLAEALKH